jgi:(+)-trans-carveol dehydrogenase/(-)-trans-carveol dehydrogenase
MRRFEGLVAVITGAARGQGRNHAVRLAQEGADIIAIDNCAGIPGVAYPAATPADLAQTVAMVEGLGRRAVPGQVDIRDLPQLQQALDDGVAALGRLDIVAANAGISSVFQPATELSEQSWHDMIDVNLTGAWHTVKVAVPHLIAGGRGGAVIITSSAAGLRAYPNIAHYVSSKHGLVGLMRALALELAPHGIRVNSLHPTQVETDMILNDAMYRLLRPDLDNPGRDDMAVVSQAMHALPVPWGQPDDVSNALLFLASQESRYVTGVALPVDAGCLIK